MYIAFDCQRGSRVGYLLMWCQLQLMLLDTNISRFSWHSFKFFCSGLDWLLNTDYLYTVPVYLDFHKNWQCECAIFSVYFSIKD